MGAVTALAVSPLRLAAGVDAGVTARLARYMVAAREQVLAHPVTVACKQRILDTFAAMVSGSRMKPGVMAANYVRGLGGEQWARSSRQTSGPVNAALANAMCAHADETDDFDPVTKAHLGCCVAGQSPKRRAVAVTSSFRR